MLLIGGALLSLCPGLMTGVIGLAMIVLALGSNMISSKKPAGSASGVPAADANGG